MANGLPSLPSRASVLTAIVTEFKARVGDADYPRYRHIADPYWIDIWDRDAAAFGQDVWWQRFLAWMDTNIGPRIHGSGATPPGASLLSGNTTPILVIGGLIAVAMLFGRQRRRAP